MNNDEQFFYDNAGYSWDPMKDEDQEAGHVRCAISLAEAEKVAIKAGVTFEWDVDTDIDSSEWRDDVEPYATWNCTASYEGSGEVFAALGGVDFGPSGSPWKTDYARVVEAELALEYELPIPPSELSKRIRAEFGNKLVVDMTEADVARYKQIRAEVCAPIRDPS